MKATIYYRTDGGDIENGIDREFKDFEEFKTFDFTGNTSVILYFHDTVSAMPCMNEQGSMGLDIRLRENRYLHITHFIETPTLYSVLSRNDFSDTLCSLQPADRKREEIVGDTMIGFVEYELMMEAVEYYFFQGDMKPSLFWFCWVDEPLTDKQRKILKRKVERYEKKYKKLTKGKK